ncbi:DUF4177 domain-containing protein [Litoreibacter janthinus]|uniref:DUF4177 domain-containing protein n=1 Tax=Litoreibacter janthinus TaxID=670154 RepID=A0A1I6GP70_9RHOB|nr:DUF4177 domain-containing protein [Litoreibacter janthinus]SFR43857.1 protein of unknown function [Litoreibacter janthinus]
MSKFEYQVVPAPRKGKSVRKVRGTEAKFANTISSLMNEMAAEGWEYQRAETLPCEERQGLTGKTVKYHSLLVFRRALAEDVAADEVAAPAVVAAPVVAAPDPKPEPEEAARAEPVLSRDAAAGPAPEGFMEPDEAADDDKRGVAAE